MSPGSRLAAALRAGVRRAAAHARRALNEWSGDADYERYVRRCAGRGEAALDRRRYFARRLEERYRASGRCC